MKNNQIFNIPNIFTTMNLFCGFLAIVQASNGFYTQAAWLIFAASILDGLDGRIARASGQSTDIGLQMDSLCDVISFGVAPAFLVYKTHLSVYQPIGVALAFMPLIFVAFRLARFNLYTIKYGKKHDFRGLPSPMAAVTFASLVILYQKFGWQWINKAVLLMIPLLCILMVTTIAYDGIPRFTLKKGGANHVKLLIFITAFIFMFFFPELSLFVSMMIYITSGPARVIWLLIHDQRADIDIIPENNER